MITTINIKTLGETEIGISQQNLTFNEDGDVVSVTLKNDVLLFTAKEIIERVVPLKAQQELKEIKALLQAAINYIDKSPCDPDITAEQWEAYRVYKHLLNKHEDKRK